MFRHKTKAAFLVAALLQSFVLNAHAGSKCGGLPELVGEGQSGVSPSYPAPALWPVETLPEAYAAAGNYHVYFTESFRRLPEGEQLRHLQTTKASLMRLPALALQTISDGGYKIVLVGNSLADVPELALRLPKIGKADLLLGAGLMTTSEKSVFVVVNEKNDTVRKNGVSRIILHELGHAFDHSVGFLQAYRKQERHYEQYSRSSQDFAAAHLAAEKMIKGSGIEAIQEFFADMFYFYFAEEKTRIQLEENLPETYRIFETWFAGECALENPRAR